MTCCVIKFKSVKEGTTEIYDEIRNIEQSVSESEKCCYRVGNKCIQYKFPTFGKYCDELLEKKCPYFTTASKAGTDDFRKKLILGY